MRYHTPTNSAWLVYFQGYAILPLPPISFPIVWICLHLYGTARIKALFQFLKEKKVSILFSDFYCLLSTKFHISYKIEQQQCSWWSGWGNWVEIWKSWAQVHLWPPVRRAELSFSFVSVCKQLVSFLVSWDGKPSAILCKLETHHSWQTGQVFFRF